MTLFAGSHLISLDSRLPLSTEDTRDPLQSCQQLSLQPPTPVGTDTPLAANRVACPLAVYFAERMQGLRKGDPTVHKCEASPLTGVAATTDIKRPHPETKRRQNTRVEGTGLFRKRTRPAPHVRMATKREPLTGDTSPQNKYPQSCKRLSRSGF